MIDFYALTSPNVLKVFIALEELQLAYRPIYVDVWNGDQFAPEFGKINLNRKIPVIVDHDGPGGKPYTVIESGAILMYLAQKTGKLLPADTAKRFDVLQWLMVQMSSIGPISGQAVHFSKFAPGGNDYALSRYRTELNRLWDVHNERLAQHPFIGGDEYSIADIALLPWLRNHEFLGMPLAKWPHIAKYIETLSMRPAVKKVYGEILPSIKSSRDTATDDQKDRVFGRGQYATA